MVEYNLFWFIVLLIIGISFISLAIFYSIQMAFGQDIDPKGYCLYSKTYPYTVLCKQMTIDEMCDKFYDTGNWALYTKLACMLR